MSDDDCVQHIASLSSDDGLSDGDTECSELIARAMETEAGVVADTDVWSGAGWGPSGSVTPEAGAGASAGAGGSGDGGCSGALAALRDSFHMDMFGVGFGFGGHGGFSGFAGGSGGCGGFPEAVAASDASFALVVASASAATSVSPSAPSAGRPLLLIPAAAAASPSSPRRRRRCCFQTRVPLPELARYVDQHQHVWPEIQRKLWAAGWHDYSLFVRADGLVVGLYETDAGSHDEAVRRLDEQVGAGGRGGGGPAGGWVGGAGDCRVREREGQTERQRQKSAPSCWIGRRAPLPVLPPIQH
jgi:hypothetical protein